jgi:hypothetical protein
MGSSVFRMPALAALDVRFFAVTRLFFLLCRPRRRYTRLYLQMSPSLECGFGGRTVAIEDWRA